MNLRFLPDRYPAINKQDVKNVGKLQKIHHWILYMLIKF